MAFEYLENLGEAQDALKFTQGSELQSRFSEFVMMRIGLAKEALENGSPSRYATGGLSQSIEPEFFIDGEMIGVEVFAADYWDFINQGVNGIENSWGSEYNFKTLYPSEGMIDAFAGTGGLEGWMKTKGITELQYYSQDGELVVKDLVTDNDFRSAAFVFARAVKKKGIEPNGFMDLAFGDEVLDRFDEFLLDAIENIL